MRPKHTSRYPRSALRVRRTTSLDTKIYIRIWYFTESTLKIIFTPANKYQLDKSSTNWSKLRIWRPSVRRCRSWQLQRRFPMYMCVPWQAQLAPNIYCILTEYWRMLRAVEFYVFVHLNIELYVFLARLIFV